MFSVVPNVKTKKTLNMLEKSHGDNYIKTARTCCRSTYRMCMYVYTGIF